MNQISFEEELIWFNHQKKDIEDKAKESMQNSIKKLAKEFEYRAENAGYVFDEKTLSFKLDLVYGMELFLSCQGKDKYPSPKALLHRISKVNDLLFKEYIKCFEGTVPGKLPSIEVRQKILETSKNIAMTNSDFFNEFSACFKQCTWSGKQAAEVLEDQGLDIDKFTRLYPKDSYAYSLDGLKIVDYYGGFEYYLPNIQCEIHFFTASGTSFSKVYNNKDCGLILRPSSTPVVRVMAEDMVFPLEKNASE